ncbi:MAG: methyltransferase small domain protein [Hyphomicrobiales bacterium]|nr:methyltransferase small domain protein [Hyphomicrobiales bacterium]
MSDAAAHMDAIYRLQRHIYDITRKPYLLGRDQLIRELDVPHGGSVIEIGCGTARNLLEIANVYPSASCHGIDVSKLMLDKARQSIAAAGMEKRVTVAFADATEFDPLQLFGRKQFDRVVISYALSMIPQWECVLRSSVTLLRPEGSLHIVDFGAQMGLPRWFRAALFGWLAGFSVHPRLDLGERVSCIAGEAGREAQFAPIRRGYAALATIGPIDKPA